MNAKPEMLVPRLVLQAPTRRFVERGDLGVEGTLQNHPSDPLLPAGIISVTVLK